MEPVRHAQCRPPVAGAFGTLEVLEGRPAPDDPAAVHRRDRPNHAQVLQTRQCIENGGEPLGFTFVEHRLEDDFARRECRSLTLRQRPDLADIERSANFGRRRGCRDRRHHTSLTAPIVRSERQIAVSSQPAQIGAFRRLTQHNAARGLAGEDDEKVDGGVGGDGDGELSGAEIEEGHGEAHGDVDGEQEEC